MAHLVEVFAQVKRVLHPTATCWVVISDSYATGGNLLGIPWCLAFALQADGWVLRQEICWSKTAPMPESVRNRCTRSHETIFMLAKQARYYYDQDAVREPHARLWDARSNGTVGRNGYRRITPVGGGAQPGRPAPHLAGRNKRSVWTINPQPFVAARYGVKDSEHFAVFPEALVTPMILAGTSEAGCCPRCLAPWRRVVRRTPARPGVTGGVSYGGATAAATDVAGARQRLKMRGGGFGGGSAHDAGWQPTCPCQAGPPVPCRVMDIFCGSGTTGLVAKKLGRHFTGIELNESYVRLSEKRIAGVCEPLFSAAVLSDDGAAAR